MNRRIKRAAAFVCGASLGTSSLLGNASLYAQAEVSGWGNLRGLRVNDELVEFTTAVGIYDASFATLTLSQREGPTRTTAYARDGQSVSVGVHLRFGSAPRPTTTATRPTTRGPRTVPPGLDYTVRYTDAAPGECRVSVDLTAAAALDTGGVYYVLTLPGRSAAGATARLIDGADAKDVALAAPDARGRFLTGNGRGLRLTTKEGKTIEVDFDAATDVFVQPAPKRPPAGPPAEGDEAADAPADVQVCFPLHVGRVAAGGTATAAFTIRAGGEADARPVTVTIDPTKTGRPFDGVGGNFRMQSDRDPTHVDYLLANLRCPCGRVAMPWNVWQPDENVPPAFSTADAAPAAGPVNMNSLPAAIGMAERLAKMRVPLIVSVWQPPRWATLPDDGRGYPGSMRLDPAKYDAICRSIGSYLLYLRDRCGAEPELFSFNESNLGINVRQTPEDHAEATRRLGAHFQAIGLKTKILIGDTSDVPPIGFVGPVMNDAAARPFIGAVAFHSWRGATDAQYQRWADAAEQLNVPLFDAEGGNDAQAYGYPNVFREPWYALDEAAEYVRILRICQPRSILQWQFTSDYSVVVVDADGTVRPTQRFFNLKQLNATPTGSAWIDARSSSPSVYAAAYADARTGVYSAHVVNNGARRQTTLAGLPTGVTTLTAYVTDATRGMTSLPDVPVKDGSATLDLPPQAFVTFVGTVAK